VGTELARIGDDLEVTLRSLAREIAMDLQDVETILGNHQIRPKDAKKYLNHPRFQAMLAEACTHWNSGLNVQERIKLKMQTLVEEAIPEMFKRLHDPRFSDSAKVELLKTLMKGGNVGVDPKEAGALGEKVQITINMGADSKLEFQKEPVMIDVTPEVKHG
jgi:hypothetical protein